MESPPEKIAVELTQKEAIILFEYLRRCDEEGTYRFIDQAEKRVLWNVECLLERQLTAIFDQNYLALLKDAWAAIRDKED